ncbi:MAG TPA: adenine deaminase [Mariniphaga anaerophila]|uniref:Adenine deaminase n=1 Tax=Mariniphaga anaerophila TaxID=1484053 RepID=A0A831PK13_9BACT|nr:adenine deaminase [Mariniphaga anaerophila]
MKIDGLIIDVVQKKIFPGRLEIKDRKIHKVQPLNDAPQKYILPGFIDSHVHIESSMVLPSRFAEVAVSHGTLATVSDPHEIANVMGIDGINFMIEDGKRVPFRFYFGAPSCVPATPFDHSGSVIGSEEVKHLLSRDDIYYLSEMMNFPGVVNKQDDIIKKLSFAKMLNKPVDGHAPGLTGEDLEKYIGEGISTDHESYSLEEAREKIQKGMMIQIRNGSAALNFDALHPLIGEFPEKIMFCTDDCHPNDLINGHINKMVKMAISKGYDLFDVLRAASYVPNRHYNLNIGMLQTGDSADFIVVDNLEALNVEEVWNNGEIIFRNRTYQWKRPDATAVNNFIKRRIQKRDIEIRSSSKSRTIKVIQALDGELITNSFSSKMNITDGKIEADPSNDILKIVVINRYSKRKPAIGFIKGFGLKEGAIAGSIAHDSHNLIAVGVQDSDIVAVLNKLMETGGGIIAKKGNHIVNLSLPVAGLMSLDAVKDVALKYQKLNKLAWESGSSLKAPFMTLAFMSLLVIPELKIGDKGLFNVNDFAYTSLFAE